MNNKSYFIFLSAFSEPETRAVRDFVLPRRGKIKARTDFYVYYFFTVVLKDQYSITQWPWSAPDASLCTAVHVIICVLVYERQFM